MKKHISGRKLSRTSNERKQLFRNLMYSLSQNGFVVTSRAKAKAVTPIVEKLITVAKVDSLTNFRKLISEIGDVQIAHNLQVVGKAFVNRPGGYTRILKLANQKGDDSEIVRLEWVEKIVVPEVVKTENKEHLIKESTKTQIEKRNIKKPIRKQYKKSIKKT